MVGYRPQGFYVISVEERHLRSGLMRLKFETTRGAFPAIGHLGDQTERAVVMLPGYSGGFAGPGMLYPRLAAELSAHGIGALRLHYTFPGDCVQCSIDTLVALQHLADEGVRDTILLGWSFGAAVAIAAGALGRTVRGIAALAPVQDACCCVRKVQRKPILLLHGEKDTTSSADVSRDIHQKTIGPRRLVTYPGAGHSLLEARDEVQSELTAWILGMLDEARAAA